jgi:Zn-dependent protease with chaperone function
MSAAEQVTHSAGDSVARPNVLAFVAPTTIRFIVLVGALLSAGLFMGTWLHNESAVGDEWADRVAECYGINGGPPGGDWLVQQRERQRCTAVVERRRFVYAIGGACTALALGLGIAIAAPHIIERRRRLRLVDPRLAPAIERFQALAGEAGVASPPALMVGRATLRDAFSYGITGRYRVAIPPAVLVRWRDSTTFDPLIRHELAHVRHHDVAIAWIARSMWIVVVPLLALPLAWGILSGDTSLISSYVWRAALLGAVTLLASSALLRSREYDADLRASRTPESAAALSALLQRVSPPRHGRWRTFLSYHPSAEDRRAVLEDPGRHTAMTFGDGLTAAFLAGWTLPLLTALVSTIAAGLAFVSAAILVGPLLGATLGLGLWRQSLIRRITGNRVRVAPVALGVLVGYALGALASLAQTGAEGVGEYGHIAVNALTPIAVCGATVVAAGLGELFADIAPRFRSPRASWIACILLVGTLFAVTLWAATTLSLAVDQGGRPLASLVLMTVLSAYGTAIVALAFAAVTAWALLVIRNDALAPSWAVLGDSRPPWPAAAKPRLLGTVMVGIAAGTVGALMLIGFRMIAGPAKDEAEQLARSGTYILLAAGVAAAAAIALVVLQPDRGLGAALLAAPVASATTVIGLLALNTALGGQLTAAFVDAFMRPGVTLGFLSILVVAVASLVLQARRTSAMSATLPAVITAAVLAGVASFGVLAGHQAAGNTHWSDPTPTVDPVVPRALYVDVVARPLLDGRVATASALTALKAEHLSNDVIAARMRAEILPVLRQMLDSAESVRLDDPEVRTVHEHAIAGARLNVMGFEKLATALEQNDRQLLEEGNALLIDGNAEWEQWAAGTAKL